MKTFQTKSKKLTGTSFKEVFNKSHRLFVQIKSKSKRKPYIRSIYFKKDKIFLNLFWSHIHEKKNFRDKVRRMKYFSCAIELMKNSRFDPITKENPNRSSELLHRFAVITCEKDLFFVQIKEDKRTGKKRLLSVFPVEK